MINHIFKDFTEKFSHFLGACEEGFKNELIIQLYSSSYMPSHPIVHYGQKIEAVHFVVQGEVNLFTKDRMQFFVLPERAVFGDYSLIFDLKSNMTI